LKEAFEIFSHYIENLQNVKNAPETLSHNLKDLCEELNTIINDTVPEKAKEFTPLLQTLQKVFEDMNEKSGGQHLDSSHQEISCSEKQTKQCQTDQELSLISPFSNVNTAETSYEKTQISPFVVVNQEGVLETIKEMAKYEKDFKKLEKSLKETTEKYNDQLKPFRTSFTQLETLFEIKELDSEKDIQKVFEKIEIHEKQLKATNPQGSPQNLSLPEIAHHHEEASPRLTEDLQNSPPNKKLAALEKEKIQLKDKMEALASTIVSSVCQLNDFSRLKNSCQQKEVWSNVLDEKAFFDKIEKIKSELSNAIKPIALPIHSLCVLKQKTLSPTNDHDKENQPLHAKSENINEESSQFSNPLQERNYLKNQIATLSNKLFHNISASGDPLDLDHKLLEDLNRLQGTLKAEIEAGVLSKSGEFSTFARGVNLFEISSIRRVNTTESPNDREMSELKIDLDKVKKENVILQRTVAILKEKASKLDYINEKLTEMNRNLEIQAQGLQNDNVMLKRSQSEQGQVMSLREELRSMKEKEKEYIQQINILTERRENIPGSSSSLSKQQHQLQACIDEENNEYSGENEQQEEVDILASARLVNSVKTGGTNNESKRDSFEKILDNVRLELATIGTTGGKSTKKAHGFEEKNRLKTPNKNLNMLFQDIQMTKKKAEEDEPTENTEGQNSEAKTEDTEKNRVVAKSYSVPAKIKHKFESIDGPTSTILEAEIKALDVKLRSFLKQIQQLLQNHVANQGEEVSVVSFESIKDALTQGILSYTEKMHAKLQMLTHTKAGQDQDQETLLFTQGLEQEAKDLNTMNDQNILEIFKIRNELRKAEEKLFITDNAGESVDEDLTKTIQELRSELNKKLRGVSEDKEKLFADIIQDFKEEKMKLYNEIARKDQETERLVDKMSMLMETTHETSNQNQSLKEQLAQKSKEMKAQIDELTREREHLRYELEEHYQAQQEKLKFLLNSFQLEFFRYISVMHENNSQRLEYDVDELVNYAASIINGNLVKNPKPVSNFVSPPRNESPTIKLNFDFLNASPISLDQNASDTQLIEHISTNYSAEQAYQILYALADNILIANKILKLAGSKGENMLKKTVDNIEASIVEHNKSIRAFYKQHKTVKNKAECVEIMVFFSSLLNFFNKTKGIRNFICYLIVS